MPRSSASRSIPIKVLKASAATVAGSVSPFLVPQLPSSSWNSASPHRRPAASSDEACSSSSASSSSCSSPFASRRRSAASIVSSSAFSSSSSSSVARRHVATTLDLPLPPTIAATPWLGQLAPLESLREHLLAAAVALQRSLTFHAWEVDQAKAEAAATTSGSGGDGGGDGATDGLHPMYRPELFTVVFQGRTWDQQQIVSAYATPGAERALEEDAASSSSVAGHVLEGVPTGESLRRLLDALGLDEEVFFLWQAVILTDDVRTALNIMKEQSSVRSMAPTGEPLWPPWLIERVLYKSKTSIDVHLCLALACHHLPYLPIRWQTRILGQCIDQAAKAQMTAALPDLVDLALDRNLFRGLHAERPKKKSTDASLGGRYLNGLLASFVKIDPPFNSFDPSLHAQIIRVLEELQARAIPLSTASFRSLCNIRFLRDPALRSRLLSFEQLQARGPTKSLVTELLKVSSLEQDLEKSDLCMGLLDALEEQSQVATPSTSRTLSGVSGSKLIGPELFSRQSVSYISSLPVNEAIEYFDTLRLAELDLPRWSPSSAPSSMALAASSSSSSFNRAASSFGNKAMSTSIVRPPPPSPRPTLRVKGGPISSEPTARELSEYHCGRAWESLLRRCASPESGIATADLLHAVEAASNQLGTRILLVNAAMNGLLLRGDAQAAHRLFQRTVLEQGIVPTAATLTLYIWAVSDLKSRPISMLELKIIDRWSVRHGLDRILTPGMLPSETDCYPSLAESQVLVFPKQRPSTSTSAARQQQAAMSLNAPSAIPEVRVQLTAHLFCRLFKNLRSAGRDADAPQQLAIILRLWDAAETRWGVRHTVEMLDGLLAAAASAQAHEPPKEPSSNALLRPSAVKRTNWVKARTEVFFAKTTVAELALAEPAWLRVKTFFEEILFTNWPRLKTLPNPLEPTASRGPLYPFLEADDRANDASVSVLNSSSPFNSSSPVEAIHRRLPAPSVYSHLNPSAKTFHHYIRLLCTHGLTDQVPLAFGYMRERGLTPLVETVQLALVALVEADPEADARWSYVKDNSSSARATKLGLTAEASGPENERNALVLGAFWFSTDRMTMEKRLMRWVRECWGEGVLPEGAELKKEWSVWRWRMSKGKIRASRTKAAPLADLDSAWSGVASEAEIRP